MKRTRSLAVVTAAGASLACASPYHAAARLSTLDAEPRSGVMRRRSLLVVAAALLWSPACAWRSYCPAPITADLSTVDAEALTWELPEGEEPVLTLTFDRDPGPAAERRLPLLPGPVGGWVFGGFRSAGPTQDGRQNVDFAPPGEPCEGTFEWAVTLSLPGREDSEPVLFSGLRDYPPPQVFCPWDDEDNCLELRMGWRE